MLVRRELADRLGNEGHYFAAGQPRRKLVPAGPDLAQITACAGIIDYLNDIYIYHEGADVTPVERYRIVHDLFHAHERKLLGPLLRHLDGRDDMQVLGPTDGARRTPTVSVVPLLRPFPEVVVARTQQRMMVGSGDFYAPTYWRGWG